MGTKRDGNIRACLECGERMRYETRQDRVEHSGYSHVVDTAGWWCSACDEAVLDGEALMAREVAFLELRAKVEHVA